MARLKHELLSGIHTVEAVTMPEGGASSKIANSTPDYQAMNSAAKGVQGRALRPSPIDTLPPELARNRVFGSEAAAAFLGYSIAHFRRLYRAKRVPAPIMIGERKYGWRVGDLADFAASRASVVEAA